MVVELLLLQNFLLLRTQQVEVGIGRMLMDIGWIQSMTQAPIRQPLAVGAAYLGNSTDGRKPGVCPIVGQEGKLPTEDRLFPMLKLMPLYAECQGITACLMDGTSVPGIGGWINLNGNPEVRKE